MNEINLVIVANIISSFACSAIGCLYMYGVIRRHKENKQLAAQFFLCFFLFLGIAYTSLAMRSWSNILYSIAINNALYLLIFYFLNLGIQAWFKIPVTIKTISLIAVHAISLSTLQVYLYQHYPSSIQTRIFIAYLNDAFPLIYAFFICKKYKKANSIGETIITYTCLINAMIILLPYLTTLIQSHSPQFTFIITAMITQNIVVFLTLGALLSLFLFNQIDRHYQTSIHDDLTGIHNRRYFLDSIIKKQRSGELNGSVAIVDIDHFKRINDEYGHDIGDRVIQNISDIISDSLKDSIIFGRYGGEEFILYIPENINAHDYLNQLRRKVNGLVVTHASGPISCTASFGFCPVSQSDDFDSAVKKADIALYKAKNAGRNCVKQWQPEMTLNMMSRAIDAQ